MERTRTMDAGVTLFLIQSVVGLLHPPPPPPPPPPPWRRLPPPLLSLESFHGRRPSQQDRQTDRQTDRERGLTTEYFPTLNKSCQACLCDCDAVPPLQSCVTLEFPSPRHGSLPARPSRCCFQALPGCAIRTSRERSRILRCRTGSGRAKGRLRHADAALWGCRGDERPRG